MYGMVSDSQSRFLKAEDSYSSDQIISATDHWKHALWDPSDTDAAMMRVPACLIFFLFLWSIDLFVMDSIQLSYYRVLGIKPQGGSPLIFVITTALFYAVLYGFHMTYVTQYIGIDVEYGVMAFYAFVLLSFAPFFPGHESRMYFVRVMKQIIFPGSKVTFPEIMMADALCSLSKLFKDLGITIVMLYSGVYGGSGVTYHNQAMIFVAILSSLPFVLRVRQCNVQLTSAADYRARMPITLNIIKYCTSFPPILLAAAASLGYFHPLLAPAAVVMGTINSTYSYIWDIVMDWGLLTFYSTQTATAGASSIKVPIYPPLSTFSFPVHVIIASINLFLRFSWAASRLPVFARLPPAHLILLIEVAEIVRRSMWFIFRIEWEMVKTETPNRESEESTMLIEKT